MVLREDQLGGPRRINPILEKSRPRPKAQKLDFRLASSMAWPRKAANMANHHRNGPRTDFFSTDKTQFNRCEYGPGHETI